MGSFTEYKKANDLPTFYKEGMKLPENYTPIKCENCSSLNTVCIYSEGAGSIIGAYKDMEFFCNDCKKYTVYSYEYDS